MSGRILKTIFVIIIFITLGEVGYYVYITFNSAPSKSSKIPFFKSNNISSSPTIEPIYKKSIKSGQNLKPLLSDKSSEFLTNIYPKYLKSKKQNNNHSIIITERINGIVGKIGFDNQENVYEISIVDDKGLILTADFFNESNLRQAIYLKESEQGNTAIKFDQIKQGDKIEKTVKYDLTDDAKSVIQYIIKT
ncbi:hypothetical protein A3D78_04770 [Candidatus Gottesmanbacteria bacterium RIFCSPHIGHO2_02_FULL_39_14]|uniref:Uncharacterized protein n=1 Tax=Candidatus Gottesmanbacteria bacterium RIFCSPHIGHO2_02_FULL_39_14 TaxID=1798383 RepID=A0A1F5ZUP1_9BACT|nr:MAG: hypothetical protein A3D78_04770 [Candidatus Gottesmanbacteria bacterium RIFCSPHIGHO2_02_FULL_39_14]